MRYSTVSFFGIPGAVSVKVPLSAVILSELSLTAAVNTDVTFVASSAAWAKLAADRIRAPITIASNKPLVSAYLNIGFLSGFKI